MLASIKVVSRRKQHRNRANREACAKLGCDLCANLLLKRKSTEISNRRIGSDKISTRKRAKKSPISSSRFAFSDLRMQATRRNRYRAVACGDGAIPSTLRHRLRIISLFRTLSNFVVGSPTDSTVYLASFLPPPGSSLV